MTVGPRTSLLQDRLLEVGSETSVGRVGDPYDSAPADAVIGLYKTEEVCHVGPWQSIDAVEWTTAGSTH